MGFAYFPGVDNSASEFTKQFAVIRKFPADDATWTASL